MPKTKRNRLKQLTRRGRGFCPPGWIATDTDESGPGPIQISRSGFDALSPEEQDAITLAHREAVVEMVVERCRAGIESGLSVEEAVLAEVVDLLLG